MYTESEKRIFRILPNGFSARPRIRVWLSGLLILCIAAQVSAAARIKDIATIHGLESTQLVGYGLMVGLNGTGDSRQSLMANQSLRNMLKHFGITLPAQRMRVKNVAAVMVTCKLGPYVQVGSQVDVLVSSMGDASSLEGGTLLLTPLIDGNGEVYMKAQGSLSIGGFDIKSIGGEQVRKNYALVGRVPLGGVVERNNISKLPADTLRINLNQPDFTTAFRMADQINQKIGQGVASPIDAGQVQVVIPSQYQDSSRKVEFISLIEAIEIAPDQFARVVVNERTGTIVVGSNVTLSEVAIAHGNLTVEVSATPVISQPAPFSQGQTVALPQTSTQVTTESSNLMVFNESVNIQDIATALNTLGVTPRDLIAIFQALKAAGALHAEIVIM